MIILMTKMTLIRMKMKKSKNCYKVVTLKCCKVILLVKLKNLKNWKYGKLL